MNYSFKLYKIKLNHKMQDILSKHSMLSLQQRRQINSKLHNEVEYDYIQENCMQCRLKDQDVKKYLRCADKFGFSCRFPFGDNKFVSLYCVYERINGAFAIIREVGSIEEDDDDDHYYSVLNKVTPKLKNDFDPGSIKKAVMAFNDENNDYFLLRRSALGTSSGIIEIEVLYDVFTTYNILRSTKECGGGSDLWGNVGSKIIKSRLKRMLRLERSNFCPQKKNPDEVYTWMSDDNLHEYLIINYRVIGLKIYEDDYLESDYLESDIMSKTLIEWVDKL